MCIRTPIALWISRENLLESVNTGLKILLPLAVPRSINARIEYNVDYRRSNIRLGRTPSNPTSARRPVRIGRHRKICPQVRCMNLFNKLVILESPRPPDTEWPPQASDCATTFSPAPDLRSWTVKTGKVGGNCALVQTSSRPLGVLGGASLGPF